MRRYLVAVFIMLLAGRFLLQAKEGTMSPALAAAEQMFYDARYADAAAAAAKLCATDVGALAACELRTSALHFMLRRGMGDASDRKQAFARAERVPISLPTSWPRRNAAPTSHARNSRRRPAMTKRGSFSANSI
jgi:hypothetical protein